MFEKRRTGGNISRNNTLKKGRKTLFFFQRHGSKETEQRKRKIENKYIK
jgi:hypothetical protein